MRSRTLLLFALCSLPLYTEALLAGDAACRPEMKMKHLSERLRGEPKTLLAGELIIDPVSRLRGGFLAKWSGGGFEFTQEQEAVFAETAKLMSRAANFYLLEAGALLVSFAMTVADTRQFDAKAAVLLFWGIHHGWCGIHAMRGAECFQAIKRTQGNDIDYLMDAVLIQKEYWKQLLAPAYVRIACIVVLIGFHIMTSGE
mmetsp:Transcript_14540/g.34463  ORF Transcript_14540/g.34463 Transcript_14540/m.34463 type:complete len:200 (+) Transcript_14540:28-627(+)